MILVLLGLGCGAEPAPVARLVEAGETPCDADTDCLVSYHPCLDEAVCSHASDVPATPDIVCDPPEFQPPTAMCRCDGLCTPVR